MCCEGCLDWSFGKFQRDKYTKEENNGMASLVAVLDIVGLLFFTHLSPTALRVSIHRLFIQEEVGVQNSSRLSLCTES